MLILVPALAFISCSSEDDDLQPSMADVNGFLPAADDQSETAKLQREFFQRTGVYLLFSDKLSSTGIDGNPEELDIAYSIFGFSSYSYDYKYKFITDIESQRKAAADVEEYLLKRMSGKSKPFSVLLVNDCTYNYYGKVKTQGNILGARAYMFNLKDVTDGRSYYDDLIASIVQDKYKKLTDEEKAPFLDISRPYYGQNTLDPLTDQELWDLGFFKYYLGWDDGWDFPYISTDESEWFKNIFLYTREEFQEKYGSSATMIKKYNALMDIIKNMGFDL